MRLSAPRHSAGRHACRHDDRGRLHECIPRSGFRHNLCLRVTRNTPHRHGGCGSSAMDPGLRVRPELPVSVGHPDVLPAGHTSTTPPAALSDDGRRSFTAHPCATSASWRPARQPGRPCQQQLLSPQAEPEDHPPAARAEQRVGSPPRSLPLPPWPCSAGSCRDCWRWTSCPGAQPSWPSGSNAPVSRGRTEPDRCRAGRAAYQLTKEKRAV